MTLDEAPHLEAAFWAEELRAVWPRFLLHDAAADYFFAEGVFERHHGHVLAAFDEAEPGRLVARAFSVPFAIDTPTRQTLPDAGWDAIARWSHADLLSGRATHAVSALEILVRPDHQGTGLSYRMLEAMRANARRRGATRFVAPVRPNGKHLEPHTPMAEYMARTREDGLPADAWLRVHVRAGGRIVKVAPTSMTVAGTLAQWRAWTGLPFEADGPQVVPGALSPVHVSLAHDHAVYVEPNVWVEHSLA